MVLNSVRLMCFFSIFLLDVDECKLVFCNNGGICENDVENFMCICFVGFIGMFCKEGRFGFV